MTARESAQSHHPKEAPIAVFDKMVHSEEDFLGLLAYALYKRHKIEWMRGHGASDQHTFKQVACTPQQVRMYRSHAERLARHFIDESLDQLGDELRETVTNGVIVGSIESLRPGFWRALGNHALGGIASVAVALACFGLFTLYASYQETGGLEGKIKQITTPSRAPPANDSSHTQRYEAL